MFGKPISESYQILSYRQPPLRKPLSLIMTSATSSVVVYHDGAVLDTLIDSSDVAMPYVSVPTLFRESAGR